MIREYFELQHANVNGGAPVSFTAAHDGTREDATVLQRNIQMSVSGKTLVTMPPTSFKRMEIIIRLVSGSLHDHRDELVELFKQPTVTFYHWDDSAPGVEVTFENQDLQFIPMDPYRQEILCPIVLREVIS